VGPSWPALIQKNATFEHCTFFYICLSVAARVFGFVSRLGLSLVR